MPQGLGAGAGSEIVAVPFLPFVDLQTISASLSLAMTRFGIWIDRAPARPCRRPSEHAQACKCTWRDRRAQTPRRAPGRCRAMANLRHHESANLLSGAQKLRITWHACLPACRPACLPACQPAGLLADILSCRPCWLTSLQVRQVCGKLVVEHKFPWHCDTHPLHSCVYSHFSQVLLCHPTNEYYGTSILADK